MLFYYKPFLSHSFLGANQCFSYLNNFTRKQILVIKEKLENDHNTEIRTEKENPIFKYVNCSKLDGLYLLHVAIDLDMGVWA